MYRLGDNAQKSYVVHRRLTIDGILEHYEAVAHQLLAELRRSFNLLLCVGRQIKKHHNPHNTILTYPF